MAITGVSGTISNGSPITITGSGFGASGPTVLVYDDFEGGTNGAALQTNLAPVGSWHEVKTTSHATYSNAARLHGNLAARFNSSGYPVNAHPCIQAQAPSTFNSFYVQYWLNMQGGHWPSWDSYPADYNFKVFWCMSENEGTTDADVYQSLQGNNNALNIGGNDFGRTIWSGWGGDDAPPNNTWMRISWFLLGRETSAGFTEVYTTCVSNQTSQVISESGVTLLSGDTNKRREFSLNGYVRDSSDNYPTYDDVYIAYGDNARARVELGNASAYDSCTSLNVCNTPAGTSGWSDTSISCTCRTGNIPNGNGWLYVWNANGTRSAGYPVTVGGGSASPPTGTPVLSVR